MKIKNSDHRGVPPPVVFISVFFEGIKINFFSLYIKTNTVFRLSKYSCIRIDKNILGINYLFFYKRKKIQTTEVRLFV